MTDHSSSLPFVPAQEQLVQSCTGDLLTELRSFAAVANQVCLALCEAIQAAVLKARRDHLRAERLTAYRRRHEWKAGDVRPLLSIGVNDVARRRMAKLRGRGRPVVHQHRPVESALQNGLAAWPCLFQENATPDHRRRAFRTWPRWKHHVEALYRGEVELARKEWGKGAHDHAERAVAGALRMSQGKVHAICGEVRALRREDADAANFPSMTLAEFEMWMERGKWPRRLDA